MSRREEAFEYPKSTAIETDGKRVYVAEVWVFEYPDGRFESLKRRHLVTDPAELKALSV